MKLFKGGHEAPLFFYTEDGQAHATFVLDLAGRLICRGQAGSIGTFLPYGIAVVEYTYSSHNPLLWEVTVDDIRMKVAEQLKAMPYTAKLLTRLYPEGELATFPELFVNPQVYDFSHADAMRAIELYEVSDQDIRDTLKQTLADCGIYQIPDTRQFNETYHALADGEIVTESVRQVSTGWMSNTHIYKQSIVTPE